MKLYRILMIAAGMFAGSCVAADAVNCTSEGYDPAQYRVFIDQPTGYAFIKTPCGWHFVRQIEADKIADAILVAHSLPPTPGNAVCYTPPGNHDGVDRQTDIN